MERSLVSLCIDWII